jgi:hypothetical protein
MRSRGEYWRAAGTEWELAERANDSWGPMANSGKYWAVAEDQWAYLGARWYITYYIHTSYINTHHDSMNPIWKMSIVRRSEKYVDGHQGTCFCVLLCFVFAFAFALLCFDLLSLASL